MKLTIRPATAKNLSMLFITVGWGFLCLLLSATAVASDTIDTGFFESLDIGPELFVKKSRGKASSRRQASKRTAHQKKNPQQQSQKKPAINNPPQDKGNTSSGPVLAGSTPTSNVMELPEMWHYVLLTLIAIVFVVILLVLLRIYKNTREVESTDNIVHQIKKLSGDLDEQSKAVREVKLRIQKTENSFLKVLAHHIDDKNEQLLKDVDMQLHDFAAIQKSSSQQYTTINSKIADIENLLGSLKEFVAEQKQEIRRMQDGYDWSVVNGLCLGIIDVVDRIDEELRSSNSKKEKNRLNEVRGLLVIMLETHHVTEIQPDEKKNYSQAESDDRCEIVFCDTEKEDMHGKLAKVVQSSFVYEGPKGNDKVVRRAKIEVYRQADG